MIKKTNIEELYEMHEAKMQDYIMTKQALNMSKDVIKKTDELNAYLTREQQCKLQELLELEHERGSLLDKEIFVYAFSLAIMLWTEALGKKNAL